VVDDAADKAERDWAKDKDGKEGVGGEKQRYVSLCDTNGCKMLRIRKERWHRAARTSYARPGLPGG